MCLVALERLLLQTASKHWELTPRSSRRATIDTKRALRRQQVSLQSSDERFVSAVVRIVAVNDLQGQQWPGMNGIARGEALARSELRAVSPGSIALAKTRSGTRAEGVPSMHALQLSLKHLSSLPAALALSCACGCQPLEPKVPEEAPAAAELTMPPQTPPKSPHADEKREARERAEAWLRLVDQGEYAESWEAAAKLFQASTAKDQWATALQGARSPLGQSSSRNLRAAEYKTQLEGAPAGEYVVVHYDSAFANKPTAREIVTLRKQTDNSWKVAGYFVQ